MKVAVIGAGLAGLGASYFLLDKGHEVTIFDAGGGASRVCSGLMHPYPGLSARRSFAAEEALELSLKLMDEVGGVAMRDGILRSAQNEEQEARLKSYGDVEHLGEKLYLIKSGVTVDCNRYLDGLKEICIKRGALYKQQRLNDLPDGFDQLVIAAGYGIMDFAECNQLKVEFLKGQLLSIEGESPYPKSYIAKGYIAKRAGGFEVGSTYERGFTSIEPNLEVALTKLPQLVNLNNYSQISCKAGVRVCPIGSYLPLVSRLSDRLVVFTGLGSRGLLYHSYFGKQVADLI